jgi:hypothetical protein
MLGQVAGRELRAVLECAQVELDLLTSGPAKGERADVTETGTIDGHDHARHLGGDLDPAWFPDLQVVYDGRNSLAELVAKLPARVAYRGVGVPDGRPAPVAVD